MASANSGRRLADVNSPLTSTSESASCGVISHPVDDISVTPGSSTPASGQSQHGSPNSDDGPRYSPLSQPFGDRPLNRTSAGAAVRQSISDLPSPPPFTPQRMSGMSTASPDTVQQSAAAGGAAGDVFDVPCSPEGGMSAAGSCGSSGPAAGSETPGVTSGWGFGSSTKATASEAFAFARHPAATSNAGSPDVQPFAGTAVPGAKVAASPSTEPSNLLLQAARNMAVSQDADTASERSSVSGASRSSSMRDSPAILLRKAKAVIDRQVAVGGTARLSRGGKGSKQGNTQQTPADKGIPTATTPQNTPMDVEAEHCGDQHMLLPSSLVIVAPVIAVGSPISGIPASASTAGKDSPAAPAAAGAAATPGAAERAQTPVQLATPADSQADVVSIGRTCTPASVLAASSVSARRLDFTEAGQEMEEAAAAGGNAVDTATPAASPQRQQRQQQQQGSYSPSLEASELLPATPLSLEELEARMLSSATKALFAREMPDVDIGSDGAFTFDNIKYLSSTDGATVVEAFATADAEEQEAGAAAGPKRRGLLGESCSTLLWLLAGFAIVATSFVAVEMLPQTLAPPGCFCMEHNLDACLKADQALNKQLSSEPTGWRLATKRAAWYLQDAADVLLLRRQLPKGVTADDFSHAWISSVSDERWRAVPVGKAAELFAAVPQHLWPPAVVEKLQGPEGAAALLKQQRQAAPDDLVATGNAEAAAAAADSAPAEATESANPAAAVDLAEEQHAPEQQVEGELSSMPAAEEAAVPGPAASAEPERQAEAAPEHVQEPAAATTAEEQQAQGEVRSMPSSEAPATPEPAWQEEASDVQVQEPAAAAAGEAATPEPSAPSQPVRQEGAAVDEGQEQAAAAPVVEQAAAAPAEEQALAELEPANAESEQPAAAAETTNEQSPLPEAATAEQAAAAQPAAAPLEPSAEEEPVQRADDAAGPAEEQAVDDAAAGAPVATEQQGQQDEAEHAAVAAETASEQQQQQQQDEAEVEQLAQDKLHELEEVVEPATEPDSHDAAAAAPEDGWQVPAALQEEPVAPEQPAALHQEQPALEQPAALQEERPAAVHEEQPALEPEVPAAGKSLSTTQQQQDAAPAAAAAAVRTVRATALQAALGAVLALAGACAAMLFLPAIKGWLLRNPQEAEDEEQQEEAEQDAGPTADDEAAADDEATAAAEAEEAEAAAAAEAVPAAAEDPHAGLLSDEEEVPRRRRRSSAAAAAGQSPMQALLGSVGDVAGMAANILTPRSKPPLPPAAAAAAAEGGAGPSAAAATAGGRTPRATRSGGAAAASGGRRAARSVSGAAGAAAAGAESDGEEVAQPASAGRGRRTAAAAATPRGRRTSVLPAVPEDMQGADDPNAGLLSDEEAAAAPVRARGRRQSAPAAGAPAAAAAAAVPAAAGGRRRSATGAAAAAASGGAEQPAAAPRATRRSSRLE